MRVSRLELGQFHIDFLMDKAATDIYAIERLFIGKTIYIDILQSTDTYSNTTNSDHIRMMSIPTSCIKYYATQHTIRVLDVFKHLYNNNVIKVDLTNDNTKFVCRGNNHYTISNVSHLTRTCQ